MTDNKKIDDGGPAFQTFRQHALGSVVEVNPGMSLRDWLAGIAMQATLSSAKAGNEEGIPEMLKIVARISYSAADAMIAARKGGE